jgi:hypothetical protein
MIIVIGKNSRLFRSIEHKVVGVTAISHTETENADFSKSEKIVVFSWSKQNQFENIKLIKSLPIEKVVFISTIAVLSLQKRAQWADYPNWKFEIEQLVLRQGGTVVRIGICSDRILEGLTGEIPFTSEGDIIKMLQEAGGLKPGVIDLFSLRETNAGFWKNIIAFTTKQVLDVLPANRYFQIPFCFFLNKVGIYSYSYTGDALGFFSSEIQCGYGVLGSHYGVTHENKRRKYIISCKQNRRLTSNGFVNTLIGYDKIGLARSWHGVKIVKSDDGLFTKSVPIFNVRPAPPRSAILGEAKKVQIKDSFISLEVEETKKRNTYFASKVILAAGPLENASLLSDYGNEVSYFSDHETGIIGSVDSSEAIKAGYLKEHLCFVLPLKVTDHNVSGRRFIIDVRPIVPSRHIVGENPNAFYLDSTQTLVKKLIVGFSVQRINEAIFNKIGCGVKTRRASVCIQILVEDCIKWSHDGSSERKRISADEWQQIHKYLATVFSSYASIPVPLTVDAQHIHGGSDILNTPKLYQAISDGRIIILGSPTKSSLGVFHHTEQIKTKIKNNAYYCLDSDSLS